MSAFDWGDSFEVADVLTSSRGDPEMHQHEDMKMLVTHVTGMGCDKNDNPVSVTITVMNREDDYISIHLSTPQIMELAQRLIWDLENYGQEQLEEEEKDEEEEE